MIKFAISRAVRLYQGDNGIWRCESERGGVIRWSSLNTRDKAKAESLYQRIKQGYEDAAARQKLRASEATATGAATPSPVGKRQPPRPAS
jgi:hypothetical protein